MDIYSDDCTVCDSHFPVYCTKTLTPDPDTSHTPQVTLLYPSSYDSDWQECLNKQTGILSSLTAALNAGMLDTSKENFLRKGEYTFL